MSVAHLLSHPKLSDFLFPHKGGYKTIPPCRKILKTIKVEVLNISHFFQESEKYIKIT